MRLKRCPAPSKEERDLVTLTEAATKQLKEIIAAENKGELALRVYVAGGG